MRMQMGMRGVECRGVVNSAGRAMSYTRAVVQLSVAKGEEEVQNEKNDFCTGQCARIWPSLPFFLFLFHFSSSRLSKIHSFSLSTLHVRPALSHSCLHHIHDTDDAYATQRKWRGLFLQKYSSLLLTMVAPMEGSLLYITPAHAAIRFLFTENILSASSMAKSVVDFFMTNDLSSCYLAD
jgi:hypothetical protein